MAIFSQDQGEFEKPLQLAFIYIHALKSNNEVLGQSLKLMQASPHTHPKIMNSVLCLFAFNVKKLMINPDQRT